MKKLIVIVFLAGISIAALAQRGQVVSRGGAKSVYIIRPQVIVGAYSPFFSPFGYGYPFVYSPFGYYPYYPYGMGYSRPTQLQIKKDDIRADYQDKIYSVRRDNSLSSEQKRETIHALKKQRKQDIKDLVANYHRQTSNEKTQAVE